jgi:hypothetical protein
MNQKDDYYMKSLLTAIAILGLLIKLFLSSIVNMENSNYKAESTIIGYGLVICALAGLVFFKINIDSNLRISVIIKNIFEQSIPYLIIITLLSIIIFLNSRYKDKINSGNVGDQYNTISGVSTFMFFIQLYFLYKYFSASLDSKYYKMDNESEKKKFKMMTYVFAPINFSLVGITYIILNYFLTDG